VSLAELNGLDPDDTLLEGTVLTLGVPTTGGMSADSSASTGGSPQAMISSRHPVG
jgi:hypothetical protein